MTRGPGRKGGAAPAARTRMPRTQRRAQLLTIGEVARRSGVAASALGAAAEAERAGLRQEELEARLLAGRALISAGERDTPHILTSSSSPATICRGTANSVWVLNVV